jgi:hypothetical protein
MKTVLNKFWNGWKRFAHRFARVQTLIFITIFYFLILAPLSALFRLFGWDPLETKGFKSKKPSGWKPVKDKSPDLSSLKRQS